MNTNSLLLSLMIEFQYQRVKKWYLMSTCLTLSITRYVSRLKWSNPGKGVVPFPTPRCSSYRKRNLLVILDYSWPTLQLVDQEVLNSSIDSSWISALSAELTIYWQYPQQRDKKCLEYDTKLHLIVRLQFRRSGECSIRFHCHYSQVHSDLEW